MSDCVITINSDSFQVACLGLTPCTRPVILFSCSASCTAYTLRSYSVRGLEASVERLSVVISKIYMIDGLYVFFFLKSLFFFLRGRFTERKRGRGERSFTCWLTPQTAAVTRAESAWNHEPTAVSGSPTCIQGPMDLGHPLRFSQVISRELVGKWSRQVLNWTYMRYQQLKYGVGC